ncbi:putative PEX14/17 peroxisomal biogenesis factor 14/17 [Triangularia setosa]|uniref:Peroxisomal membrane protein PEX14 n=1 Tax=Triangularia setosa TaxID=2587417 RepID=A0AAN6VYF2_9PEZI|nr:putative PEX14/17 peroxisomal biogenesis factor 14/17 [Podospora setosa]
MTDADQKPDPEVPPATEPAVLETPPQNVEPSTNTEAEPTKAESKPESENNTREATIEQARIFLKDTETKKATPEQRAEFLKSKGLSDTDIQDLLKEVTQDAPTPSEAPLTTSPVLLPKEDRPPIITYPEFLTTPTRPPPLITPSGFLNTLYAFGGLSTLIYGTSKFVLEPMVTTLTSSRIELAETANDRLSKLVAKLEETVSEIPVYPNHNNNPSPRVSLDVQSQYDDPTELFHRDIGIQTEDTPRSSLQISTPLFPGNSAAESAMSYQSRRLGGLVSSLKQVNEGLVSQTEGYADVKTVLEVLRDDLDGLASQTSGDYMSGGGGYNMYGSRQEPDDEIKKAKENIRRVKGVLLSTRNFPGSGSTGGGVITAGGGSRSGFGIGVR